MTLIFHPGIREDVREAARYYVKEGGRKLGEQFKASVDEALGRVRVHPTRWSLIAPGVRRCPCRNNIPHRIFYTIKPNHVFILAVSHPSREPGHWRHRLENA